MVSRTSRLPYEEFRARGYREMTTPYFSIKAKRNFRKEGRFGMIVSASSIKNAVQRNFWRRQAKSVFLKIAPCGFDIFVILRRPVASSQRGAFRKTLGDTMMFLISNL
jgi:ribonuclease P protein component